MSWDTQAWAAKQRPGMASAKLVLLGLASCSDAKHCAHPSVAWLCAFSDLNRKTVISALQKLQSGMFPLITDTGSRVGKSGQVKVYRLEAEQTSMADAGGEVHYAYRLDRADTEEYYFGVRSFIGDPSRDAYNGSGKWPTAMRFANISLNKTIIGVFATRLEAEVAEALAIKASLDDERCRNIEYKGTEKGIPKPVLLNGEIAEDSTGFSVEASQKGDTEPLLEPITLSPDKSGDPPLAAKRPKSERPEKAKFIPTDWAPPPIAALTPLAGKLAAQWPAGAYETIAEAFANHWQSESRAVGRKLDWDKTWAKWITSEHTRVMQAKKFGVSYGSAASKAVGPISLGAPVADQVLQCPRSAAIRSRLEADLGKAKFASLFERSAIVIDAKVVRVVAPNPFVSSCIERECGPAVERHAQAVVGGAFRGVKYETGALMIVCGGQEMAA